MEFGKATTWYFNQWEKFEDYEFPELKCNGLKRIIMNIVYLILYSIIGLLFVISLPLQLLLPIIPITIDCIFEGYNNE